MNILKAVTFATVAEATRNSSNPSASVRGNGKIMFNDAANKLIGYDGKNPDRMYFKLGKDAEGTIYLVPATAKDDNTFKAAKNNDSFQFNDIKTIASMGMLPNTRYKLAELEEDGIKFWSLTLKTAAEKQAEDEANKTAHTKEPIAPTDPQGDARIAAKVAAKAAPKPAKTAKELEAEAKKAAKADFKKSK